MTTLRLAELYQQAALQMVERHQQGPESVSVWVPITFSTAQGWLHIPDHTDYVEAELRLQDLIREVIYHHPSNMDKLKIDEVIHPGLFTLSDDELEDAESRPLEEWYADVAVDWLEEAGVKRKTAMDLVDAMLLNQALARQFYEQRPDPVVTVVVPTRNV